jgi:hypothetical protein
LSYEISERERLSIVIRNLNSYFAEKLICMDLRNMNELKMYCLRIEALRRNSTTTVRGNYPSTFQRRPNFQSSNQIHEIFEEPSEEEIFALGRFERKVHTKEISVQADMDPKPESNVRCYNCNQIGHVRAKCRKQQAAIYCYRCGTSDVTTPRCPKCNPGNFRSGVENGVAPH